MEFTCSRCGLTCCGVPAGAIQLYPICEDCFTELHNELMEDKDMNKSTYEVNGICNRCSDYTLIDVETRVCEGCSESELTFIEAIQKYNKITNDGGKTHYYASGDEGTIYRRRGNSDISGSVDASLNLLTSTGWEEYKDKELVLPKAVTYGLRYHSVSSTGSLAEDNQLNDFVDEDRLESFNYFTNKKFAQYVSDKQLIQRIELTLIELNKDVFPKEELTKLINKYLRDNHMEVLDRIIRYEL